MGGNSAAVRLPPFPLGVRFLDVGAFEIDAALDIAPAVIPAEAKLITVTWFIERRISKKTLAIFLLCDRPDGGIRAFQLGHELWVAWNFDWAHVGS